MQKKGQAVSFDLIISVILFLTVFAVLITIWQNQNYSAATQLQLQQMETTAARTLDYMIRSPGETATGAANWEEYLDFETEVRFVGLAERDRVIDKEKIKALADYVGYDTSVNQTNYDNSREKMLLTANMDYVLWLKTKGNANIMEGDCSTGTVLQAGINPTGNYLGTKTVKTIIVSKRIVHFEGSCYSGEAILELQIFDYNPY